MNENEILDDSIFEDINDDIQSENLTEDSNEEIIEESVEIKDESLGDDGTIDNLDLSEEDEAVSIVEENTLEELSEENEIEELLEEDKVEEIDVASEKELIDDIDEQLEVEDFSLDSEEEMIEDEIIIEKNDDENFITNDLENINIEFGIEAKGFILSLKMMEAMIEKGYIFKDMLNNKIFDAVMIFNGNLENTIMTSDIKIKIEDDKIQLIKG